MTADRPVPLSPDEIAALRDREEGLDWIGANTVIDRLLATLDAERAARDGEGHNAECRLYGGRGSHDYCTCGCHRRAARDGGGLRKACPECHDPWAWHLTDMHPSAHVGGQWCHCERKPALASPAPALHLGPLVENGCPACHHPEHDPGSCEWCPRCELHTDEALEWLRRVEPDLLALAAPAPALDATVTREEFSTALERIDVIWDHATEAMSESERKTYGDGFYAPALDVLYRVADALASPAPALDLWAEMDAEDRERGDEIERSSREGGPSPSPAPAAALDATTFHDAWIGRGMLCGGTHAIGEALCQNVVEVVNAIVRPAPGPALDAERLADQIATLFGWTAHREGTERERALYVLWREWHRIVGERTEHPDLSDERIRALSEQRVAEVEAIRRGDDPFAAERAAQEADRADD